MQTANRELIELETRFWHALVEEDADTATSLLDEPAMMVSSHGAMSFNHADYRQMVEKAPMLVRSFELSDMKVVQPTEDTAILTYHVKQDIGFRDGSKDQTQEMTDSSVWTRKNGHWLCVMHTETPVEKH
jgi:ketosteroid isomerase-like protein